MAGFPFGKVKIAAGSESEMKPYSRRLALGQMNFLTTSQSRETNPSARRNAPALAHNQLFQDAASKGAGPLQSRAPAVAGASWLGGSGHTKPAFVRRPVRPQIRAGGGQEKAPLQAQYIDAVDAAHRPRQVESAASDGRIRGKEEAAGGRLYVSDGAPRPEIAEDALEGGVSCCGNSVGSIGSSVARVATGGAWRRPGRMSGQGGCRMSQWAPEGRSVIVTFRPDGAEDAKEENHRQSLVPNPASVGHSMEQKMRLESLVAGRNSAGGELLRRPTAHGGVPDGRGSLGVTSVTSTTVCAADKDAAAYCGRQCRVAAEAAGRGGRGHGAGHGGNARERGGRGGRGSGGPGGTRLVCRRAAVQLQSAARGMLARRLHAQLGLERRKAVARARLERREEEEKAKRKTREVERVVRKAEECSLEAASASKAAMSAEEARIVAEVDARWRGWLAAVRATAATAHADLCRRLHDAEVARVKAEAAAARAEADRAEMAVECEGMAAALVRQAVAAPVTAGPAWRPAMRKLVVVEECEWEAEAGTQTEALSVSAAAMQTEAVEAVGVAVAAVQTEAARTQSMDWPLQGQFPLH